MGEAPLFEVRDLAKRYANAPALDGVSFTVAPGEFTVLLGASGSGKSTLLNLLGGMDTPDSGSILFRGQNIVRFNEKQLRSYRRDSIGFVFQSFHLMNDITALENVLLQARLTDSQPLAEKVLNRVGLVKKHNAYPGQLSGGEQQRVSIARALVKSPAVLLCDEPTGALDYATGKEVLTLFEKLCRQKGMTVVFVTHTKEIAAMADHVIVLRSGRIAEEYYPETQKPAAEIEW